MHHMQEQQQRVQLPAKITLLLPGCEVASPAGLAPSRPAPAFTCGGDVSSKQRQAKHISLVPLQPTVVRALGLVTFLPHTQAAAPPRGEHQAAAAAFASASVCGEGVVTGNLAGGGRHGATLVVTQLVLLLLLLLMLLGLLGLSLLSFTLLLLLLFAPELLCWI